LAGRALNYSMHPLTAAELGKDFNLNHSLMFGNLPSVYTESNPKDVCASKILFFDVGIFRTLRPMGHLDAPGEVEGICFESLLFQELKAINDYYNLGYNIYYWRTSNNLEVDFILYGERGLKAFEIKKRGRVPSSELRGLKAFLKDYPAAKAYYIYGAERRMSEGTIDIISLDYALKNLPAILE